MASIDLTIKPAQTEITLKPNASYTQAYDIINNSAEAIRLSSSVEAWLPKDNSGSVQYDANITNTDFSFSLVNSDLQLGQDFILEAHQKRQLVLRITGHTPESVDAYYTFFVNQKPLNSSVIGRQNLGRLGSHILISSDSQELAAPELQLKNFIITPRFRDIFQKINFNGEIFNPSLHYSSINGQLIITKNGQDFSRQDLFPYTVLAQSSRTLACLNSQQESIPCSLPAPLWPGVYSGTIILDNGRQQSTNSFSFFVLPYSFILIISMIFFLLLLSLRNKQSISSKPSV